MLAAEDLLPLPLGSLPIALFRGRLDGMYTPKVGFKAAEPLVECNAGLGNRQTRCSRLLIGSLPVRSPP